MSTSKQKEWTFNIVDGPGRERVFDACEHAYDKGYKIEVEFKIVFDSTDGCDMTNAFTLYMSDFKLNRIGHNDNSGYSFILGGWCKADLGFDDNNPRFYRMRTYYHENSRLPHPEIDDYLQPYSFEAHYNAKTRRGRISFLQ